MACSMPPMYWSTGIHLAAAAWLNGSSVAHGSQKRRKYQDESTKVSIVSVSRRAGPPHFGHVVFTQSSAAASGDLPFGAKSLMSGSSTGSWSSGKGMRPSVSQYTIGIGQPQ